MQFPNTSQYQQQSISRPRPKYAEISKPNYEVQLKPPPGPASPAATTTTTSRVSPNQAAVTAQLKPSTHAVPQPRISPAGNAATLMTQSYPSPASPAAAGQLSSNGSASTLQLLKPEKVGLTATSKPAASSSSYSASGRGPLDKDLLLGLEKELGLAEASANLMPPSPAPATGLATNSILFCFLSCTKSLICLEGKSMTPRQETLFSSVPPSNSLVSVLDH